MGKKERKEKKVKKAKKHKKDKIKANRLKEDQKRLEDAHYHTSSRTNKSSCGDNTIQIIISDKIPSQAEHVQETALIGGPVVVSSALEFQPTFCQQNDSLCDINNVDNNETSQHHHQQQQQSKDVTLLLFYQYIEPAWDEDQFQKAIRFVEQKGNEYAITGRMRVAYEGLNCTLTGSFQNVRLWCRALREYEQGKYFAKTEFKLTDDLPRGQAFPKLHVFKVDELVHYGLDGKHHEVPSIHMTGVHLEPHQYHEKMAEGDTVIIDVRNHYEAAIGRFDPPGAVYIDPCMRKSTEFPSWLDKPSTKDLLRGKQVLMYCTGGVRCERASALLRMKMETEEDVKALGIKGVYQLQGGIDKYFKQFPDGGYWKGKNYVFDKRFAHAPPLLEGLERAQKLKENLESSTTKAVDENSPTEAGSEVKVESDVKRIKKRKTEESMVASSNQTSCLKADAEVVVISSQGNVDTLNISTTVLGKCESCHKPWDKYRGKRRCPTCGVPSLICKDCYDADSKGVRPLGPFIRCDLCVAENITSKRQLVQKLDMDQEQYEKKLKLKFPIRKSVGHDENPNHLSSSKAGSGTRLWIKNMCVKKMDQETLCENIPNITHIQWINDRKTGKWLGSAYVEMRSTKDAEYAMSEVNGKEILGRHIKIAYSPPDPKDKWPLPNTCII